MNETLFSLSKNKKSGFSRLFFFLKIYYYIIYFYFCYSSCYRNHAWLFLKESEGDQNIQWKRMARAIFLRVVILCCLNLISELGVFFLQTRQFCFECLDINASWCTQVPFNVVHSIGWSLRLLVQTNQDFGQGINHTTLFEILSELFFFRIRCLVGRLFE